jgi:hypothetical protein
VEKADTYQLTEVDPNDLKIRKGVSPGAGTPEKGAIDVDDKTKVIDGNHRAAKAKLDEDEIIDAYVPEDSDLVKED